MSSQLQGANCVTLALNSAALAIGSTPSQIAIGATTNFVINGRIYQKATAATIALVIEPNSGIVPTAPNSFRTLAAGESCNLSVILDSAGTVTVAQGDVVTAGQLAPVVPAPAGKCLIGAVKVSNVTNPFIFGTTAFNAAGVTTTYNNLAGHPGASI